MIPQRLTASVPSGNPSLVPLCSSNDDDDDEDRPESSATDCLRLSLPLRPASPLAKSNHLPPVYGFHSPEDSDPLEQGQYHTGQEARGERSQRVAKFAAQLQSFFRLPASVKVSRLQKMRTKNVSKAKQLDQEAEKLRREMSVLKGMREASSLQVELVQSDVTRARTNLENVNEEIETEVRQMADKIVSEMKLTQYYQSKVLSLLTSIHNLQVNKPGRVGFPQSAVGSMMSPPPLQQTALIPNPTAATTTTTTGVTSRPPSAGGGRVGAAGVSLQPLQLLSAQSKVTPALSQKPWSQPPRPSTSTAAELPEQVKVGSKDPFQKRKRGKWSSTPSQQDSSLSSSSALSVVPGISDERGSIPKPLASSALALSLSPGEGTQPTIILPQTPSPPTPQLVATIRAKLITEQLDITTAKALRVICSDTASHSIPPQWALALTQDTTDDFTQNSKLLNAASAAENGSSLGLLGIALNSFDSFLKDAEVQDALEISKELFTIVHRLLKGARDCTTCLPELVQVQAAQLLGLILPLSVSTEIFPNLHVLKTLLSLHVDLLALGGRVRQLVLTSDVLRALGLLLAFFRGEALGAEATPATLIPLAHRLLAALLLASADSAGRILLRTADTIGPVLNFLVAAVAKIRLLVQGGGRGGTNTTAASVAEMLTRAAQVALNLAANNLNKRIMKDYGLSSYIVGLITDTKLWLSLLELGDIDVDSLRGYLLRILCNLSLLPSVIDEMLLDEIGQDGSGLTDALVELVVEGEHTPLGLHAAKLLLRMLAHGLSVFGDSAEVGTMARDVVALDSVRGATQNQRSETSTHRRMLSSDFNDATPHNVFQESEEESFSPAGSPKMSRSASANASTGGGGREGDNMPSNQSQQRGTVAQPLQGLGVVGVGNGLGPESHDASAFLQRMRESVVPKIFSAVARKLVDAGAGGRGRRRGEEEVEALSYSSAAFVSAVALLAAFPSAHTPLSSDRYEALLRKNAVYSASKTCQYGWVSSIPEESVVESIGLVRDTQPTTSGSFLGGTGFQDTGGSSGGNQVLVIPAHTVDCSQMVEELAARGLELIEGDWDGNKSEDRSKEDSLSPSGGADMLGLPFHAKQRMFKGLNETMSADIKALTKAYKAATGMEYKTMYIKELLPDEREENTQVGDVGDVSGNQMTSRAIVPATYGTKALVFSYGHELTDNTAVDVYATRHAHSMLLCTYLLQRPENTAEMDAHRQSVDAFLLLSTDSTRSQHKQRGSTASHPPTTTPGYDFKVIPMMMNAMTLYYSSIIHGAKEGSLGNELHLLCDMFYVVKVLVLRVSELLQKPEIPPTPIALATDQSLLYPGVKNYELREAATCALGKTVSGILISALMALRSLNALLDVFTDLGAREEEGANGLGVVCATLSASNIEAVLNVADGIAYESLLCVFGLFDLIQKDNIEACGDSVMESVLLQLSRSIASICSCRLLMRDSCPVELRNIATTVFSEVLRLIDAGGFKAPMPSVQFVLGIVCKDGYCDRSEA